MLGPMLSEQKALESNDWFKSGVDRFYLAMIKKNDRLMYDYDIRWGEHVYVGIGCYGEPSDQRSFSIKNNIVTDTRLNERLYVEDFDIHVGGGKVPKGKCKVLLGDPNKYTVIKDKESLAGGGNWTTVTQDTGTGALTCRSCASLQRCGCFSGYSRRSEYHSSRLSSVFSLQVTGVVVIQHR